MRSLLVYQKLLNRKRADQEYIPTIEEVQDIVETQLMECNFPAFKQFKARTERSMSMSFVFKREKVE